jgi:cold shock CspA family protein
MFEAGTVKWFDNRDNKRFGFITPDEPGPEIFFHYNGFRWFEARDGNVEFTELTPDARQPRFPKQFDRVVFTRGRGSKGPIAQPWGYQRYHEKLVEQLESGPNYGTRFLYVTNCQGNLPETSFGHYGTLRSLRSRVRELERKYKVAPWENDEELQARMSDEDRAEYEAEKEMFDRYRYMVEDRGYPRPNNIIEVIPTPGMEKRLGRAFRYYSEPDGRGLSSFRAITVVEIPKEYEYTGIMERDYLEDGRELSWSEASAMLAEHKPVFGFSSYWHTWYRLLALYKEDNRLAREIVVCLTPINDEWSEDVKPICILDRFACSFDKDNPGPFPILPDDVRENIETAVGPDLAKRLLTEDFMVQITIEQIQAAERNNRGSGRKTTTLDKILAATA